MEAKARGVRRSVRAALHELDGITSEELSPLKLESLVSAYRALERAMLFLPVWQPAEPRFAPAHASLKAETQQLDEALADALRALDDSVRQREFNTTALIGLAQRLCRTHAAGAPSGRFAQTAHIMSCELTRMLNIAARAARPGRMAKAGWVRDGSRQPASPRAVVDPQSRRFGR